MQTVEPVIETAGRVYRVQAGGEVRLECRVRDLQSMVLMWKQGPRVLTAGELLVRRDPRLSLAGTDLVIASLEPGDGVGACSTVLRCTELFCAGRVRVRDRG